VGGEGVHVDGACVGVRGAGGEGVRAVGEEDQVVRG
jgi:hypothetical protein